MLEIESFEPPAEFRERALWSDPKVYKEAAADPVAWWTARSKELLDWDVEPTEGLDDSDPPFYRWFEDGRLNASAQCLDRHVEAGLEPRRPRESVKQVRWSRRRNSTGPDGKRRVFALLR